MPYQNYFPASYPQMYPQMPVPQPQPQIQSQPQQSQNAYIGLLPIPSEKDARNYPVALNSSVTFIDENAPYIYSKTMNGSQLDPPKFEKYKLVKVDDIPIQEEKHEPQSEYVTKSEFDRIQTEIRNLKASIKGLSKAQTKGAKYESSDE